MVKFIPNDEPVAFYTDADGFEHCEERELLRQFLEAGGDAVILDDSGVTRVRFPGSAVSGEPPAI